MVNRLPGFLFVYRHINQIPHKHVIQFVGPSVDFDDSPDIVGWMCLLTVSACFLIFKSVLCCNLHILHVVYENMWATHEQILSQVLDIFYVYIHTPIFMYTNNGKCMYHNVWHMLGIPSSNPRSQVNILYKWCFTGKISSKTKTRIFQQAMFDYWTLNMWCFLRFMWFR